MELSLTGDFAQELLARARKDKTLAQAIARQCLKEVEPAAMAEFLLDDDVAVSLLAERLKSNPDATVQELEQLPRRGDGAAVRSRAPRKTARKAPRRKKTASRPAAAKPRRAGKRRRRRLKPQQVQALKGEVQQLLASHPGSTRKEITAAVSLPTPAIYRRIMGELQEEGVVTVKGEKSKAVYSLAK